MSAQNELPRPRSRLWANRLWILSGILGATTLGATAAIIHDASRQTAAAHLVARSTAHQVAVVAAGRLENLAIQTFAPVSPWETESNATPAAELDALVRAQASSGRCQCRDTMPADAFFRFDAASGSVDIRDSRGGADSGAAFKAAVAGIARADAARPPTPHHASVHFGVSSSLGGRGVVTIVRPNASGSARSVYGLVGNAHDIAIAIFAIVTGARSSDGNVQSVVLDSTSIEVKTENASTPIFGAIDDDHLFRASTSPSGALEGLTVTTALTRQQAIRSLFVSQRELWHLGLLTIATILAIVFAIGSSRRELLLARTRSDFIAGVSHDLRMPLAQILIASETLTLKREKDERERHRLSSSIVREARRLMSIVDNVLLFSRSGAVAMKPRLEPLSIRTLFGDVIDAVNLAVDDAGQTIEADDGGLAILGDRQLLRQALVNLVDNALKYGKPGQRIRLVAEAGKSSTVRLAVEDQGPGVPESERARIFEPYERLARDQTSERTGTGLGLAVVRHIAQVCGGQVWIDDTYTSGARAVIELPASAIRTSAMPAQELV